MNEPLIFEDIDGRPLDLHFGDGTGLSQLATELCLRLASIHPGRVPAFMLSDTFQRSHPGLWSSTNELAFRPPTNTERRKVRSILLPKTSFFDYQHLGFQYEHDLIKNSFDLDCHVLTCDENNELFRERILILEEENDLTYIKLDTSWQSKIRRDFPDETLAAAVYRVVATFAGIPPYIEPLQTVLAANSKEILKTCILPYVSTTNLSNIGQNILSL